MRTIYITALLLVGVSQIWSQCSCTDCPINDIYGTGFFAEESQIIVNGLSNPTLGVNGQQICEVRMNFFTHSPGDLRATLRTPSGDEIELISYSNQIQTFRFLTFDISFVPCNTTATPDVGYSSTYSSSEFSAVTSQSFNGSYYPEDGNCLENLTGSANGIYTLILEDPNQTFNTDLLDWEIIFCDSNGLSCQTCEPFDLNSIGTSPVLACQGSPSLNFANFNPTWIGSAPSANYGLTYFVTNVATGVVFERSNTIDLTTSGPATYEICGLSYLLSDAGLLPPTFGGYTIADVQTDINNGVYCADLSNNCVTVEIQPDLAAPTINWPSTMCVGTTYRIPITNYDPQYTYQIATSSGAFGILFFDNNTGELVINPASDIVDINICISILEDCDNSESCGTINVLPSALTPVLDAPLGVCTGDGGTVTVTNAQPGDNYTWSISGPGSITTNNNDNIDFTSSSAGQINICADLTNGCGTSQTCVTIIVTDPAPPATNAQATYCLPTNLFAGNPNGSSTSMLWEQISGPGTITFVNPNVVATQWTADLPGTYVVRLTKENNGCITFDEATITLLPANVPPTLSGPFTFCDNVTSNVAINNPDPNTTYVWTINGPGVITSNNGDNVDVEVTGNGNLQVCVDATNQCGTSNVCWTANATIPIPATANASATYCMPGGTFNGSVNGSSNQIEYTQLSGPGTITFTTPLFIQTDWTVDLPGTYTVELFKNFNGCDTTEVFTFDVVETPTATEVVTCANGEFTIEITFSGGTAPYSVFGSTISGNVYNSPPYPSGSAVLTTFTDANGCDGDVFVQEFCACVTDAGTMDQTPIELCDFTDVANGIHNNDATLDGDDIGVYVLHTSSTNTLGTIISTNNTGSFGFVSPPMVNGQVYYISYVVGNDDGAGSVDLTDACLSVSLGQPVTWTDITIMPSIVGDPIACDLSLEVGATLSPNVSGGSSIWTMVSAPIGGSASFSCQSLGCSPTVNFTEAGVYVLRYTLDFQGCTYSEDLTVTVEAAFTTTTPVITCDAADGTYTVTFDLIGGTTPFDVNGTNLGGSTYTSSPIALGNPYTFTVGESGNCPDVLLNGVDNCNCISDAGTVPPGPVVVCSDQLATTSVSGTTLDNGDVGQYILHDLAGNTLGTILDQNISGAFGLLPGMNAGQSYYISYVVGNDDGTGSPDLNDACLSVANGTEVVWIDYPTLDLGPSITSCSGDQVITAITDPSAIISWTYNPLSAQQDGNLDGSTPGVLAFSGGSVGVHTIDATSSLGNCSTTESITIEVLPQGQISNLVENCTGVDYTVSFDIDGGAAPYFINSVLFSGSQYESSPIPSGSNYSIIVTDSNGCEIANISGSRNCDCTTDAGTMSSAPLAFCGIEDTISLFADGNAVLDFDDISLYVLHDGSPSVIGDVLQTSQDGSFSFEAPLLEDSTYYITYVVGNAINGDNIDFDDPCLDFTTGISVVWYADFNVLYADTIVQCFNDLLLSEQLEVEDVQTDVRIIAGPGAIVSTESDPLGIIYTFDGPGLYQLEVTNRRNLCVDVDTISFTLLEPVDLSIFGDQTLCDDVITLPAVIDDQRLEFSTSSPDFVVTPIGDSIQISSEVGGLALIVVEGTSFFCAEVDSFTLSLSPELTINSITYECDPSGTTAEVVVTYSGGDGAYVVNGIVSDSTTMVFTNIDSSQPFVVSVSSGNCPTITDTIDINCGCSNSPANLPLTALLVCPGDSIVSSFVDFGQTGPNQRRLVLLHDGNATQVGNILEISDEPVFTLNQSTTYPDTLWMTVYIGPVTGTNTPILDDSCAVLGNAEPVVLVPQAALTVEAPQSLCLDESASISIASTGLYPLTIEVTIDGQSASYLISDDSEVNIPIQAVDTNDIDVNILYLDYPCQSQDESLSIQVEACDCTIYNFNTPTGICNSGQIINLSDWEANQRPATYSIVQGDANINDNDLSISNTFEGELILLATPTLPEACDSTYTLTLDVEKSRSLILTESTIELCPDDTQQINLDVFVFSASPIGNWSPAAIIEPQDLDIGSTVVTYTIDAGDYCTSASADITITKTPPLDYIITSNDPDCLEAFGSIALSIGDSTLLGSITLNGSAITEDLLVNLEPDAYNIILSDTSNCVYDENVVINEIESIDVTITDLSIGEGENEFLVRSQVQGGNGNYIYQWVVAGDTISNTDDFISIQIDDDTEVQIFVSDDSGCSAEDIIVLRVVGERIEWIMPNIFNPSSGTNNRITIPANSDIAEVLSWNIYSRWGNLVYQAGGFNPNEQEVGWNGQFNGSEVGNGVYVYYIQYRDSQGNIEQMVGDITILR